METVVRTARALVLEAMEAGWAGPPFDPILLADRLGIGVMPKDDVPDARLVPSGPVSVSIEFNPNQPQVRIRFSVAHELAHTLFPDHAENVRSRGEAQGDDWQLELLCNIAAAEFLMPIGSGEELESGHVDLESLIKLRKTYGVSTEALFLRMVKLTREPCAVFAAARIHQGSTPPGFRIDYVVPSRSWPIRIPQGLELSGSAALSDCTAVGFTSRGSERWSPSLPEMTVECIGIPAFPGDLFPRIVGVLRHGPETTAVPLLSLIEVRGDATAPRGAGRKIIAHVVNDKTPNWGAGFARKLKDKWPEVQEGFARWSSEDSSNLSLGKSHTTLVSEELSIFHMVAQHGYGPSPQPRIRYGALAKCLGQCGEYALERGATVHMPRIGTGFGGGQWSIIRELIDESLLRRGLQVTVYVPPDTNLPGEEQEVLSSWNAES